MKTPSSEIITQLEALNIPPTDAIELLLVLAGDKPATSWWYAQTIYPPGQPAQQLGRKTFDEVVAWAKKSGMSFDVSEESVNTARLVFGGVEGQRLRDELSAKGHPADIEAEAAAAAEQDRLTLFVAGDKHWLDIMLKADSARDPQLLGEAFGFPATAITAYINHQAIPPDRVKAPTETKAFAQYMLSRDQPQQDLETGARWAATVKRLSPKLYELVVDGQASRERMAHRQLRVMLLATALLAVAQVGQFIAIHDINTSGHESGLALFFALATIFLVPTALILTAAIVLAVRHWWRNHERLMILGVINTLIALNLTWFFIDQCSWSQVFGLALKGCHR